MCPKQQDDINSLLLRIAKSINSATKKSILRNRRILKILKDSGRIETQCVYKPIPLGAPASESAAID